jgi:hypothetical protein
MNESGFNPFEKPTPTPENKREGLKKKLLAKAGFLTTLISGALMLTNTADAQTKKKHGFAPARSATGAPARTPVPTPEGPDRMMPLNVPNPDDRVDAPLHREPRVPRIEPRPLVPIPLHRSKIHHEDKVSKYIPEKRVSYDLENTGGVESSMEESKAATRVHDEIAPFAKEILHATPEQIAAIDSARWKQLEHSWKKVSAMNEQIRAQSNLPESAEEKMISKILEYKGKPPVDTGVSERSKFLDTFGNELNLLEPELATEGGVDFLRDFIQRVSQAAIEYEKEINDDAGEGEAGYHHSTGETPTDIEYANTRWVNLYARMKKLAEKYHVDTPSDPKFK